MSELHTDTLRVIELKDLGETELVTGGDRSPRPGFLNPFRRQMMKSLKEEATAGPLRMTTGRRPNEVVSEAGELCVRHEKRLSPTQGTAYSVKHRRLKEGAIKSRQDRAWSVRRTHRLSSVIQTTRHARAQSRTLGNGESEDDLSSEKGAQHQGAGGPEESAALGSMWLRSVVVPWRDREGEGQKVGSDLPPFQAPCRGGVDVLCLPAHQAGQRGRINRTVEVTQGHRW